MYFFCFYYIYVKEILPYYLYFCPIWIKFCTKDINEILIGNFEFRGSQHIVLKKFLSLLSTLIA